MTYSHRIHQLATVFSLVCLAAFPDFGYADRSKQRGVAIPDKPVTAIQGMTRLDRNDNGAALTLPVDSKEAWRQLNRVLEDLGITAKQQDARRQYLLSDWVLWVWDPKKEKGRSKPPLKLLSRTYERHRFEFTVNPDTTESNAVIYISDKMRQKEVDLTPDSGYTWLQWQDAPVQVDAAWSFARRLQGNFESALSSRLVPSGVAAPRIIEPAPISKPAIREQPAVTPVPAAKSAAATAVIVEPATRLPVPVPSRPAIRQRSIERVQTKAPDEELQQAVEKPPASAAQKTRPVPLPSTAPKEITQPDGNKAVQSKPPAIDAQRAAAEEPEPSSVTSRPPLPAPPSGTAARAVVQPPTTPEKPPKADDPPPTETADVPPASTPQTTQGGLLVEGEMDVTWQALLQAIDALGIKLDSSDRAQHMLTTQWINAMYDKKKQQFTLQSKNEERWAFNLWGKGHQRHRFQLILIPVGNGARTMVYAYHTGFQVETDRTPDSSQTMLYWKEHDTRPAAAIAFLRRLQLVVRH